MRNLLCVLSLLVVSACASKAPDSLTPVGVRIWQANEAVVALGTVQHAAIALNAVAICDSAVPPVCHPAVSDANTRIVVETVTSALSTIVEIPEGWRATSTAALDAIIRQLDDAGKTKLIPYLTAARSIISVL